jgi:hypothetical protein
MDMGHFFSLPHFSPYFLRLLPGGCLAPFCIRLRLRSGDAGSRITKAKKITGTSVKLFKEMPHAHEWFKKGGNSLQDSDAGNVWRGQQL